MSRWQPKGLPCRAVHLLLVVFLVVLQVHAATVGVSTSVLVTCGSSGDQRAGSKILFGDAGISLELDAATLGVRNLTVFVAGGRQQSFLPSVPVGPPWAGRADSIWQLNTTDCEAHLDAGLIT